MRVHYLSPEKLRPMGFREFSPMTFKNVQEVDTPEEADVVSIPLPLREILQPAHQGVHMGRRELKLIIDHFKLDPKRVVAFDCSDWEETYAETNPDCLFVRCNTKGWMLRSMPRTISWPWPVEDWKDVMPVPDGGFKFDVSGHMWLSSNVRIVACDSVKTAFGDRADIVTRREFYGYIERDAPQRADLLKRAMKASMQNSRIALCPRSIHNVFPYRFFEALSAGRVPALFCTDYVLPWADKIDYASCCLLLEDQDASNAGPIIKAFLDTTSDEKLIEMGKRGREYFERWLHRDRWSELWTEAVEAALKRDGMLRA